MSSDNLTDLQGRIERITFTSEETGYTVAKVKAYGRRELIMIIGSIINPIPGEMTFKCFLPSIGEQWVPAT